MNKEREARIPTSKKDKTADEMTTADDLLYDPNADEDDQSWIDSKRARHSLSEEIDIHSNRMQTHKKCENSDAVLNCAGCLSLLSLDCQRHELYKTQYRAMFVFNCDINFAEKFNFNQKTRTRKKKEEDVPSVRSQDDTYYNVNCSVCKTQVAVYDEHEVYHFFNVLASFT